MSLRSSFFWDRFGSLREKEGVLKEERKKNEIERQRRLSSQFENWPCILLFIARGIETYYLLYLFIFIIL